MSLCCCALAGEARRKTRVPTMLLRGTRQGVQKGDVRVYTSQQFLRKVLPVRGSVGGLPQRLPWVRLQKIRV